MSGLSSAEKKTMDARAGERGAWAPSSGFRLYATRCVKLECATSRLDSAIRCEANGQHHQSQWHEREVLYLLKQIGLQNLIVKPEEDE